MNSAGSPLITAIVGFLGVIVGGLITGAIGFYMQRRQEKRAALVAARVVLNEIVKNGAGAKTLDQAQAWYHGVVFETDLWRTHRETLAGHLKGPEWAVLSKAYNSVDMILNALAQTSEGQPFRDSVNYITRTALKNCDEAREVLKPHTTAQKWTERWRQRLDRVFPPPDE